MKITKDEVRAELSTEYADHETYITYKGIRFGRMVTYGAGGNRGNIGRRTVYASRIYSPFRAEIEASKRYTLLNKITVPLAAYLRAGGTFFEPKDNING